MRLNRFVFSALFLIFTPLLALFTLGKLDAECLDVELQVTNGFRVDHISNTIKVYNPADNFLFSNHLKAKEMSQYQLGGKGRCEWCGWFVRGEGDWGWGSNGRYREDVKAPGVPISSTKAAVSRYRTQDYMVGAGYLIDLGCFPCLGLPGLCIGPLAGWSYDRQQFKLKHAITEGVVDPIINGLTFTEHWQGPLLGVDMRWHYCDFIFNAGYEYHWADWHAAWTLKGPDVINGAFSDRRHSNHAHGQVSYIQGVWYICSGFSLGIGVKYQVWRAENGREKPRAGSFAEIGLPGEVDKVTHVDWESLTASLDVGYTF